MRNDKPESERKALSELETKVMRFIWAKGTVTSEQVREGFTAEHPMKDATVRTILRRLEEKGYLTHELEGRTFLFRGLAKPENVAIQAIRQVLERFCGGSVEKLLIGMVDQEIVSSNELNELAKKIAQRRKRGS